MMVFCIIGLVIFGILGIFSAKYRRYFRESLHCMKRQLTLRPCDTNFDQEMKSKLSAALGKHSSRLGRFVFRRFAVLSWAMLIAMVASVAMIGLGAYNYVAYGNCNGPDSNDFCILNALGGGHEVSRIQPLDAGDDPTLGNPNATVKIVEIGCFSCPYTKNAEVFRQQILDKYNGDVSFTFRVMPLPKHNLSRQVAAAAYCALDQGAYWEYHDKLFEYQSIMSLQKLSEIAGELGLNQEDFDNCTQSGKYAERVEKNYNEATAAGIYATPTYFVNGKPFVGIKAFADFEDVVASEIGGSCHV